MNRTHKSLKYTVFITLAVLVVALMSATVVEKVYGTDVAQQYFYTSPVMIALWMLLSVSSIAYLVCRGINNHTATFSLHISLVLILVGAFITHICGVQGRLHLRQDGESATSFTTDDGQEYNLPFSVALNEFILEYYPGTSAPMDYVSILEVTDNNEICEGRVSMNNIFKYRNFRLYQSGYDPDGQGTILVVAYDPYGIAVTYVGYACLLLSMIFFFFAKNTAFRALLRHPLLRKAMTLLLAVGALQVQAATQTLPPTLSRNAAEQFGNLYIYYNDRVCPLQTLARDFTIKLYGKPSYRGLTPEQVLTGWFFYYDDWKNEPMIKIKGAEVAHILGIDGKYARLSDFVSVDGYKLDAALQNSEANRNRGNVDAANEKFNLVSMLVTGSIIKIFPCSNSDGSVKWYAMTDELPADIPDDQWLFIRSSLSYTAEQIARNDQVETIRLLGKIREYQLKEGGDAMPSEMKFRTEKIYNSTSYVRFLAMGSLAIGFIAFFIYCRGLVRRTPVGRWITLTLNFLLVAIGLYLTIHISLRGYVSGYIPLANGYETMLFMAWSTILLTLLVQKRHSMILPMGYIIAGFSLLVAMMGEASPRITNLMPVLQSPLLSVHVAVIMLSYSLLAFIMLNGITAIVLRYTSSNAQDAIVRLQLLSRILLYPAVFLLTIGIFVGAVWANISWGRYWGWDPKEVWALITMLIYAVMLHTASLKFLQRPMVFHLCTVLAFLSVLVTYFGVNFILGGMHSYA